MLSKVLMAWESNSAATVVRFPLSRSEKLSNVINSLLSWPVRTDTREDSRLSSSETKDSDKEITSASFEGDAASKILPVIVIHKFLVVNE